MEKITAAVLTVIGALLVTAVVSQTTEHTNAPAYSNASTQLGDKENHTEISSSTTKVTDSPISSSPTSAHENNTSTNNTASPSFVTTTATNKTVPDNTTEPGINNSNSPDIETVTEEPHSPSKPATTQQTMGQFTSPKTTHSPATGNKITYIIIFIIIILCLIGAIVYCCVQNKSRFSLEHSKNEDAQIPLSAVEPEVFEASPPKDMQTFSAAESSVPANSAPPADGAEKQEGEKATTEANQQEKENSTGTQATLPLSEKPSELTVVDLSDGDPAISTKTSVESLDMPLNENNSNNRAQAKMYGFSGDFTEICLDDEI
ncbi:flocculation protein FLO11 isoform X2 [Colossoma macropomum]|uniref:flocculation protein FLO11 isoform X2 n=1 Tax=Colossoma macropomum TaxID=42526 RepID=UPI001864CBF8|nr:flocculation protein FLO11 isoform X2 [Colossoma macropomum]